MDILNFILAPIPTRFPAIFLKIQYLVPKGIVGTASGADLFQQKISKNNTIHKTLHIVRVILAQIKHSKSKKKQGVLYKVMIFVALIRNSSDMCTLQYINPSCARRDLSRFEIKSLLHQHYFTIGQLTTPQTEVSLWV